MIYSINWQAMASLCFLQPHLEEIHTKAVALDVPTPVVDALRDLLHSESSRSLFSVLILRCGQLLTLLHLHATRNDLFKSPTPYPITLPGNTPHCSPHGNIKTRRNCFNYLQNVSRVRPPQYRKKDIAIADLERSLKCRAPRAVKSEKVCSMG